MYYNEKWYGPQAQIIKQEKEYYKVDYGISGKSDIYCFPLFRGIQIVVVDVETEEAIPTQAYEEGVLCLSYTLRGRYECEFANHKIVYIPEGYFSLCSAKCLPLSTSFPLRSCVTISLVIETDQIDQEIRTLFSLLGLSDNAFGKHLGLEKNWYLGKASPSLSNVFEAIYQAIELHSIAYFKVKALELFYYIELLSQNNGCDYQYFDKGKIQIVKKIHDELLANLEEKQSLEQLVQKHPISMTQFKIIFKQIYGESPYAYLKVYKMNVAAQYLRETSKSISEIALIVGYTNPSKFTSAFFDKYRCTPKDYRKK